MEDQAPALKNGAWDTFEGEATVYGLLEGVASVEELRIPARGFRHGPPAARPRAKLWSDYWVNARSGVLTPPPSWGSFVDGVGIWDSDDDDGGVPIIVSRRLGPDHAGLVPLVPGVVARRGQDLAGELGHALDPGLSRCGGDRKRATRSMAGVQRSR